SQRAMRDQMESASGRPEPSRHRNGQTAPRPSIRPAERPVPRPSPSLRDEMLAALPKLRAFAISLCGNVERADDLVQETMLRAFAHIDQFQPGTNLSAWLFTILRNLFRSDYRKRRREVEDSDGTLAENMISQPEQSGRLE